MRNKNRESEIGSKSGWLRSEKLGLGELESMGFRVKEHVRLRER